MDELSRFAMAGQGDHPISGDIPPFLADLRPSARRAIFRLLEFLTREEIDPDKALEYLETMEKPRIGASLASTSSSVVSQLQSNLDTESNEKWALKTGYQRQLASAKEHLAKVHEARERTRNAHQSLASELSIRVDAGFGKLKNDLENEMRDACGWRIPKAPLILKLFRLIPS